MNLIFMNSLEKRVDEDRVTTAQVSICEQQGQWHVFWNEPRDNGREEQAVWFEGAYWDEMITVFRHRIALKIGEGYRPVLESMLDEQTQSSRGKYTQALQFYSETNGSEELYEQLRGWRRTQAVKDSKVPYILASNRELRMICAFLPQTPAELQQIPGFGDNKVKLYGEAIIELTRAYERTTTFPLDWVRQEVDPQQFLQWQQKQREMKYRMEMDKQVDKRKILEGMRRGESLNELQQGVSMPRRELLLWIEELDKEGYDTEPLVEVELQRVPMAEQEAAWKALEEEGDRYLKPLLKKVYGEEELKGKDLDQAYEWLRLIRLRYRREKALHDQDAAQAG